MKGNYEISQYCKLIMIKGKEKNICIYANTHLLAS